MNSVLSSIIPEKVKEKWGGAHYLEVRLLFFVWHFFNGQK
jgi:hypothetical protein